MIDEKQSTQISKFLSMVLRHAPEKIDIELDPAGWTSVEELISKMNGAGQNIDRKTLEYVVASNKKKRFALSEDGQCIRANQGHSVEVDHGYEPSTPPEVLFHGTAVRNETSILGTGLKKGERHHVHLSCEIETALAVGSRHGKPLVFEVKSLEMHADGHKFFQSDNGVWLTDAVPSKYLSKKDIR